LTNIAVSPPTGGGRVLIIVENLPVPFDRRVWQEATALKEAGYTVSVICPTGKGYDATEETIDGIHIYRHKLPLEGAGLFGYLAEYGSALFWELFLSFRVWRRHGFDIIHACNPPDLIFLVAMVHKLFGKKFVYDQHDIAPELYEVKFNKRGPFHTLLKFFERATYWLADGSLATNETLKGRALDFGGMPEDRVWVVRSFPNLDRFKRVDPDPEAKRGHTYLVGYVGIMAEQDGVELLVRAMDHIVNTLKRTDIGCIIIGDGPDVDRLRTLSTELNLDAHVEFTGYVSGEPLLAKLSACDIGVIPDPSNVCNDNLSMNKVFEYMALGLPFVQFDLKQAQIDAGKAAVVAKDHTPEALGESMVALLEDEKKRKTMSAYALKTAHRDFHWSEEKHALLEAYRALLSGAGRQKNSAKIEAQQS